MVAWDFGAFAGRGLAGTGVGAGVKFGINKALLLVNYGGIIYPPSLRDGGRNNTPIILIFR